jgi:hypothetical protein
VTLKLPAEIKTKLQADPKTQQLAGALAFRMKSLSEKTVDTPPALRELAEALPENMQAEREMLLIGAKVLEQAQVDLANCCGAVTTVARMICSESRPLPDNSEKNSLAS